MYQNDNEQDLSPFAPTELDRAVTDFIQEAQKEFGDESDTDGTPPASNLAPTEPNEAAPTESAPAAAAAPVGTGTAPGEDPAERGLERLVAREVALREREARLSGTEKEMEALRSRVRELEPRALSEELLNKVRLSPAEGLRALGLDPDEVIRTALAEKIGDKADPATRDLLEKTRLRREMEALKAQVQEAERRQAAQAYFDQVANGARGFLAKGEEISKHAPTVAVVAKSNPDRVYQEIMEEITRDAAARSRQEPNGDVITYEEAAKRVESRWSAMKALLSSGAGPSPVAVNPPASTSTPETKQNVGKDTVKSPPSTIKPPEKPLAPWLRASRDEEDAIRAAIDEWKRSESTHK